MKYISSDPKILGGTPVIEGTRIPVARIFHLLKQGYTLNNIAEDYPQVKKSTLNKVINDIISEMENPDYVSKISKI